MSTNFPTTKDDTSSIPVESNGTVLATNHIASHTNLRDAVIALETKVGVDSSAVTTSHDYKLSGVTGGDKAVSKTGSETLTNKTLTSPIINLSSNATGDMYYRDSNGVFQRLAIGTAGQILDVSSGGIPEWIANPSASNASTTVKGIVEAATVAEVTAGTATGGTGAVLVVTPDALAASTPVFNGSGLTNVIASNPTKISLSAATTTITASGESTVVSATVPAGALGTSNAIRVKAYLKLTGNGAETTIFKCKYGGTTLITGATTTAGTFDFTGFIEFILFANASTSAQYGAFIQVMDYASSQASTEATGIHQALTGTATEASAGALTIAITVTFSSTNQTLIVYGSTVEKIY